MNVKYSDMNIEVNAMNENILI